MNQYPLTVTSSLGLSARVSSQVSPRQFHFARVIHYTANRLVTVTIPGLRTRSDLASLSGIFVPRSLGFSFAQSSVGCSSNSLSEALFIAIRESKKLKRVLELYNMEIAGPEYHILKTMLKRSIQQNLRSKNFEARNGNYETNAVVKNQGTKQREQRTLGDCWQWKANGQCSKGDNCSFRHDINKRATTTQPNPSPSYTTRQNERNVSRTRSPRGKSPSGRMSRWPCMDYLKGTCTNSFCEKWHPPECLFYMSESGCRFGEKCSYAHRQVEEQPSKRSQKNGDKSAVAMPKSTRQLGCVFQDVEPLKSSSILRKSSNIRKPIRCVQFTNPSYVMLTFETKSIAWNDLPR